MIWKIWLKISSILLLVIIPIMLAQYFLEKESIELVFDVAEKTAPVTLFDSHMQLLKQISKFDPENTSSYKKEFEKTAESKIARQDIKLVRDNLVADLLKQIVRNTLIILAVSLAFSFLIAKNIVALLKRLIAENRIHSSRLERLGSLESWQRVARMVVHELRAPITPIKLVSTDIENKYQNLTPDAFRKYLQEGTSLIRNQIAAIERMSESFTRFAKMPEVKKHPASISDFLNTFFTSYKGYRPDSVELRYTPLMLDQDIVSFDSQALGQVLFNLLKNACEANAGNKILATLACWQRNARTLITFTNTGNTIPDAVSDKIFDLYVSTKAGSDNSNLGMGLTICKKIALDHGGDLYLAKNNPTDGVVFELELPNQ
ncbi:MAG: ATP-binding protein [Bdellovibrionota bacterium]